MTQALSKTSDLKSLINSESMKEQFARALPKHLSVDRFTRISITALTRTPKLQECSPESFMKCLLDLSALGIEPDGRRAHLIPYGRDCTLILDYKGIVELVRRDPEVMDVQCITIRENDSAEWVNGVMEHKINPKIERGAVVSTYTRIAWKNGGVSIGEPFSKDDAEHAKRSSKSANSGPWKDHYVEMWKKSNIKRDSKMWPLSPEIRDAIELDSDTYSEPRQAVGRDVTNAVAQASNPFETPAIEATAEITPLNKAAMIDGIRQACAERSIEWAEASRRYRAYGVYPAGKKFDDLTDEQIAAIYEVRGIALDQEVKP